MPRRTFSFDGMSFVLDVRPDRLDLRDREYLPPTLSLPAAYPDPAQLKSYFPWDRNVVTRTINRILGQNPTTTLAVPVEDLDF